MASCECAVHRTEARRRLLVLTFTLRIGELLDGQLAVRLVLDVRGRSPPPAASPLLASRCMNGGESYSSASCRRCSASASQRAAMRSLVSRDRRAYVRTHTCSAHSSAVCAMPAPIRPSHVFSQMWHNGHCWPPLSRGFLTSRYRSRACLMVSSTHTYVCHACSLLSHHAHRSADGDVSDLVDVPATTDALVKSTRFSRLLSSASSACSLTIYNTSDLRQSKFVTVRSFPVPPFSSKFISTHNRGYQIRRRACMYSVRCATTSDSSGHCPSTGKSLL